MLPLLCGSWCARHVSCLNVLNMVDVSMLRAAEEVQRRYLRATPLPRSFSAAPRLRGSWVEPKQKSIRIVLKPRAIADQRTSNRLILSNRTCPLLEISKLRAKRRQPGRIFLSLQGAGKPVEAGLGIILLHANPCSSELRALGCQMRGWRKHCLVCMRTGGAPCDFAGTQT